MAGLAETAYYTRKGVKIGVVVLVVLIIARFILNSIQNYVNRVRPPKQAPPSVGFNVLPPIRFPAKERGEISLTLEPLPGGVVEAPDRANVYFIPSKSPHLFALQKTIDLANKLGFQFEPKQLSETEYEWVKTSPLVSKLKLETVTTFFEFTSNWRDDPSIWTNKTFFTQSQAVAAAVGFLSSLGINERDITNNPRSVVTLLKWAGTDLVAAVSLSEADFMQVDLYRAKESDYDFMTAEPKRGIARVLVSLASDPQKRVLEVNNRYRPAMLDRAETYPILTPMEAWQGFSQAKAYLAQVGSEKNIVVRRIRLGYFDPYDKQDFIQPIYVFEGQDFLGYYPALRPEWIAKQ